MSHTERAGRDLRLIEFLKARLDEDEWWAREASRSDRGDHCTETGEHWHWECETTDQPVEINPVEHEYVEGFNHSAVGLRSVEEYQSRSVGMPPHFVIRGAQETRSVDAGHIARHDPARVLADVDAKRRIIDDLVPALGAMELQLDAVGQAPLMPGHWNHIQGECDGPHAMPERYAEDLVLRLLALTYAGHPEYDERWRP